MRTNSSIFLCPIASHHIMARTLRIGQEEGCCIYESTAFKVILEVRRHVLRCVSIEQTPHNSQLIKGKTLH